MVLLYLENGQWKPLSFPPATVGRPSAAVAPLSCGFRISSINCRLRKGNNVFCSVTGAAGAAQRLWPSLSPNSTYWTGHCTSNWAGPLHETLRTTSARVSEILIDCHLCYFQTVHRVACHILFITHLNKLLPSPLPLVHPPTMMGSTLLPFSM